VCVRVCVCVQEASFFFSLKKKCIYNSAELRTGW